MRKTLILLGATIAVACLGQTPVKRSTWSHNPQDPNWIGYVRYTHEQNKSNSIARVSNWFRLTTGSHVIKWPCRHVNYDRNLRVSRAKGERITLEALHRPLPREESSIILIPSFLKKRYSQVSAVTKRFGHPSWSLIREQRDGDQFWKAEWLFWNQSDTEWKGVPLTNLTAFKNDEKAKDWIILGIQAKFEKLNNHVEYNCYGAWYIVERRFDADNNK